MKNTLKLVLFTVIILLSFNIKLNAEIKNIKSCSYKLPNNNGVTVDENDYKKITISFKYDTENPKKILYYFWADGTQKNISYDYNTLQGMLGTPVKYNYWSENDYIYAPALTNVNIDNFSCPILHASYQNEGIVTDCKSTENNGNAPHNYTCPQNSSGIILKSTANLQLWEQKNFFDVVLCEDDKCSGTEFSKKDNLITCSYYGYLDEKSKTNTNLTVLKMVLYKENDEIKLGLNYKNTLDFYLGNDGNLYTGYDTLNNKYEIKMSESNNFLSRIRTRYNTGNECPDIYIKATKVKNKLYDFSLSNTKSTEAGYFTLNINDENHNSVEEWKGEYSKMLLSYNGVSSKIGTCVDYLGSADDKDTTAYLLDKVYTIIKIGSIIILIVFTMLDFAKAITDGDKINVLEKVKIFAKRLVILILILMLPAIIDIIGNLIGVEDIICGIK